MLGTNSVSPISGWVGVGGGFDTWVSGLGNGKDVGPWQILEQVWQNEDLECETNWV